jgi:hypothetical protein
MAGRELARPELDPIEYLLNETQRTLRDARDERIELGKQIADKVAVFAKTAYELGLYPSLRVRNFWRTKPHTEPLIRISKPGRAGSQTFGYFIEKDGSLTIRQEREGIGGRDIEEVHYPVPEEELAEWGTKALVALERVFERASVRPQGPKAS